MKLTLKELKPIITYIIQNNNTLDEQGKLRVAINITSEAGYGKSAIVEEIAKELDANFVKLNLAQITETGDLAGYPICLHYACKEDASDCRGITPELIDSFVKAGYQLTGETKMSYALPEGYKNIDIDKPTILCLDDITRALPNIIQAVYELIYKQEFWSFKLPPKTTIILTSNPASGSYNVNEEDEAGVSRRVNFTVKGDIESWSEGAEREQIDDRCINFLLSYHSELMGEGDDHKHIMNARSYTMFANIISGIKDWSKPENLAMILQIASGCFADSDNIVGNLFTTFIANKLDQLISPKDMLFEKGDTVGPRIEKCVYDSEGNLKPAISSILQTRLLNFTDYYFDKLKGKSDVVINRLLEIIHAPKTLFDEDIIFNMIKTLATRYPARMNKALFIPEIRSRILA